MELNNKALELAKKWTKEGWSQTAIATELTKKGYTNKAGTRISQSQVSQLLRRNGINSFKRKKTQDTTTNTKVKTEDTVNNENTTIPLVTTSYSNKTKQSTVDDIIVHLMKMPSDNISIEGKVDLVRKLLYIESESL